MVILMYKLLSANLSRLWINKAFWITIFIMVSIVSMLCSLLISQGSTYLHIALFLSLQVIGILTSIFFSSYLGTEYGDGTIRNKTIVGHKRNSIYLANFITGVIAITAIYLAWALTGGLFGVLANISISDNIVQIILIGFTGWFACIAYIAIFTFVGMLSASKSRTSIINILTAFILLFVGLLCNSLSRPGMFTGITREVFLFLFEFNPFGQTFQIISLGVNELWHLIIYSLILTVILTSMGLYIFRKKDLK